MTMDRRENTMVAGMNLDVKECQSTHWNSNMTDAEKTAFTITGSEYSSGLTE